MPSVTRRPQPKREHTRQQRREEMERRLLDATERLMRGGASFTELSVDRLSTEAGISRASFYIYFEDKGHLLRRLTGQVFADLAESADRWWSVAGRHDPADVRAATAGTVAAYDPVVGATYGNLLTAITGRLTRVIENGQADGSIRPELPAATTASALTWMVERPCQQILPGAPISYDAELAATLAEIIWATLYLKAQPAR